jgi:tetratricopeptide (TPR) repeat protein
VIADAQTELGQYDAAVATIQKLVDLRPDLGSYSRVSYARELHGHLPEAIDAMKRAAEAGSPRQESTAWTRVQLGNLYFTTGDLTAAQVEYQRALAEVPGYLHALAGLGRVEAARGHYGPASELYKQATARQPLPEYVIALGDVYRAAGQAQEAERQYQLVGAMQRLFAANGVDLDLEIALFNLDHDRELERSLAQVRAQAGRRPSIKVQDALAWALYKNGECRPAQVAMAQALRLGTRDPLMLFHAAIIADCLGQREQARSYLEQVAALNPNFSLLYADRAREALARLGGGPTAASAARGAA